MTLRLVTPPAAPPVTFADAEKHCRLDVEGQDSDFVESETELVVSYIQAATDYLDGPLGYLGKAIVTQTWEQEFDTVADRLRLDLTPVQSVTKVEVHDGSSWQEVDAETYDLRDGEHRPCVVFSTSPTGESVRVTFVAGFGSPADVPDTIRHAVLLLVGHFYENREATVTGQSIAELPLGVAALSSKHWRLSFK